MISLQAQKQIFNLMKFDSYSRFLKSNLYKDCVSRDIRGQTLPYPGDETLDPDLRIVQEDSHVKVCWVVSQEGRILFVSYLHYFIICSN